WYEAQHPEQWPPDTSLAGRLLHQTEAGVTDRRQHCPAEEDVSEVGWERDVGVEYRAQNEPGSQRQAAAHDVANSPEGTESSVRHDLGGDVGERHATYTAAGGIDRHHR